MRDPLPKILSTFRLAQLEQRHWTALSQLSAADRVRALIALYDDDGARARGIIVGNRTRGQGSQETRPARPGPDPPGAADQEITV